VNVVDELVLLLLRILGREALHAKVDEQDEIRAARAAADAAFAARTGEDPGT
jgi:hypothetical protein